MSNQSGLLLKQDNLERGVIDVDLLNKGVYILKLRSKEGVISKSFQKQ